jgi:hypothetical protein
VSGTPASSAASIMSAQASKVAAMRREAAAAPAQGNFQMRVVLCAEIVAGQQF